MEPLLGLGGGATTAADVHYLTIFNFFTIDNFVS